MNTYIIVAFFVILFIIFGIWLSVVWWSLKNGISPMPTSYKVRRKVLASIPPTMHGTIIDLGSGWGNMAIQMAKVLPQCQIIGYETSFIPYYFSKAWIFFEKVPNIKFIRKDFFDASLKEGALIYAYLYPGAMKRLTKKFNDELSLGSIVISNTFALPGWDPVQVLEVKDMYNTRIYMYVKSNINEAALRAKPIEDTKKQSSKIMLKSS